MALSTPSTPSVAPEAPLVLDLAPYMLSLSPIDCEAIDLLFGFDFTYRGNHNLLVAEALAESCVKRFGLPALNVLGSCKGAALENQLLQHCFLERQVPVILGEHVTAEAGTGAVHTAPAHGQDDFVVGQAYGLEVYNPVGGNGVYLPDTEYFAGQHVLKANTAVIELLRERGRLFKVARLRRLPQDEVDLARAAAQGRQDDGAVAGALARLGVGAFHREEIHLRALERRPHRRIGVDAQEDVGLVVVGKRSAIVERQRTIVLAGQEHLGAEAAFDQRPQAARDRQRDVLLERSLGALGAQFVAAVTRVDDHGAQAG